MLTHIVCFKFADREHAQECVRRLRAMDGQIESLKGLEVGLDVTGSARSYDVGLITRFDDAAGLETYRVHPVHQEAASFIAGHARDVVAVDFLEENAAARS